MSEFDLIQRYFTRPARTAELGVGDDAALIRIPPGMELAVSTDMLVSGTHFFPDADPCLLGHKTLAVNVSDLAAMGAAPRWALLAASLPRADEPWIAAFSRGLFEEAARHGVELIGGDTTHGPLNLCVTIMGVVPQGTALRRDGAKPGDDIWVSGTLGEAATALAHLQGRIALDAATLTACAARLHNPTPRVQLGEALRGLAHSAIDVSDGLLADLGHLLERSCMGAEIVFEDVPVSDTMRILMRTAGNPKVLHHAILAGGDDYELCFTAPAAARDAIAGLAEKLGLPLARIGRILAASGLAVRTRDGTTINLETTGYDHFR
jgi:thiamine-monophosphate kinase